MVKIGFTGTRAGMTSKQRDMVMRMLAKFSIAEIHHGDCVGADADFHAIIQNNYPEIPIIIHPMNDDKLRAFCDGPTVKELPAKLPLIRNQDIVNQTDILIATPKEATMRQRSGTWATIRFALARKDLYSKWDVFVIHPNGELH